MSENCQRCLQPISFFDRITRGKRDARFCSPCYYQSQFEQQQKKVQEDEARKQRLAEAEAARQRHLWEARQHTLLAIRHGKLTVLSSHGLALQSDEICHMNIRAVYEKYLPTKKVTLQGNLVATDKKLYFITLQKSHTIIWSNVMQVASQEGGVYLTLAKGVGGGFYRVDDPEMACAILDVEVKIAKRQLLPYRSERVSLPQPVRNAVWQRDRGQCIECGAWGKGVELQFDHIIPISRGGSSEPGNLQLLCSVCNKKKGARI